MRRMSDFVVSKNESTNHQKISSCSEQNSKADTAEPVACASIVPENNEIKNNVEDVSILFSSETKNFHG